MPVVFTIGYTRKSLERFIQLLQEVGVDAVIDVRLRNTSQLAGFAKRDDLAFLLRTCFSIGYEHRPDLAPTAEILDAYRSDGDWPAYETSFADLLTRRQADQAGLELLARYERPCLLCAEATPNRCHRRLIAEWWAGKLPGVEVKHLPAHR
jgi:uncharacterized protein (DUF488 family)